MPEGIRCSTVFLPAITSVWPALCPPWKRTTPCARSVSQSTILPLPSSPHCVPMTTTFLALMILYCPPDKGGGRRPGGFVFRRAKSSTPRSLRSRPPCQGANRSESSQINRESRRRASTAESLANLVVAAAARDRSRDAVAISIEHHARMVVVAAQLGEVEARRDAAGLGEGAQGRQRLLQRIYFRQLLRRGLQDLGSAVELGQEKQGLARFCIQFFCQLLQLWNVFFLQRFEQLSLALRRDLGGVRDRAEHRDVADVEARAAHLRRGERLAQQPLHLEVGLDAAVPEDLGADLDRLARGAGARRPRMQHRAAIAEPRHALAVEEVRVDARDLRRDVGAQTHHPARELVHHLEGAQLQVVPCAGEQRIDVLQHRGDDQLEFVLEQQIQDGAAQRLDARRLGGQDVLDELREKPLHGQLRAQRSSSSPTSIDDSPTKRIWPSLIWVMRRNVSRQRLGARKGSTPSSISIRASAIKNKVPIAHFLVAGVRPRESLK